MAPEDSLLPETLAVRSKEEEGHMAAILLLLSSKIIGIICQITKKRGLPHGLRR